MFRKLIVSLRRQSPHVRSAVALWTAVVFTAVTTLVWMVHVPEKIAARQDDFEAEPDTPGFGDFFSDVSEQAAAAKSGLETALDDDTEVESDSPTNDNSLQAVVDRHQQAPGSGVTGAPSGSSTAPATTTASTTASSTIAVPTPSEPTPRPVRIINRASSTASSTTR